VEISLSPPSADEAAAQAATAERATMAEQ
jgi:hypothetical protein